MLYRYYHFVASARCTCIVWYEPVEGDCFISNALMVQYNLRNQVNYFSSNFIC